MTYRKPILFLTFLLLVFLTVCSDRVKTPSEGDNSTIVYNSKTVNGIEASIIFCEKINGFLLVFCFCIFNFL